MQLTAMSHPPHSLPTFAAAAREYRAAWDNLAHTRFELPPVNVNKVLRDRYRMRPQKALTRKDIWDMERRKAWDPATYIPYMVVDGGSWGRETLPDGERFSRASTQHGWIAQGDGRVLEDVYLSDATQSIFFLGRERMRGEDGRELTASDFQPIFHVEHGVGGAEDEPLNLWSIVLLTPENDPRYHRPFEQMVAAGWLPGFIEIYIARDLRVELQRMSSGPS
jgi:hypothetical protein